MVGVVPSVFLSGLGTDSVNEHKCAQARRNRDVSNMLIYAGHLREHDGCRRDYMCCIALMVALGEGDAPGAREAKPVNIFCWSGVRSFAASPTALMNAIR